MTRLAVLILALAIPASAAAAPRVDLLVVGKQRTLHGPRAVTAKPVTVKVGRRRCRVAATPLAALARTPLKVGYKDFGSCGRKRADAGALYVRSVAGERERGAGGWVYKVDNRTPTVGAGDVSAKLRRGARLLWFWCRTGGDCQRNLDVRPATKAVAPGGTLAVRVRAFDDDGRAVPGAGATVRMGSATAVADARGVATLVAPDARGRLDVVATKAGLVRSFGAEVRVR